MANRNWASGGKIYSMHVMPVLMDATIQIGATGAVASFTGSAVASVTLVSTGIYRITFQPSTNFPRLLSAAASAQSPVSGLSGVLAVEIQNNPNASVSNLASPGITVKCLDAAGALVAPANGSAVNVVMILSNSSVVLQGE